MNQTLHSFLDSLSLKAEQLIAERRKVLDPLADYILERQLKNDPVRLNFICTHNSRRSHMAQLLAATAALYVDLGNIECYSGGTEVTRIHPNAILALEEIGFAFAGADEGENPHFLVDLGEANMLEIFSKKYDDETNPTSDFAAVMVCSAAEEACPFVAGADRRFSITYEDPKEFDTDTNPVEGYLERAREIGSELLYVMKAVSKGIA